MRKGIDGLPFTSEGHEHAQNILQTNYSQTSEIINAYVENIQGLPVISGTHSAKIHDFFETLLYNVHSLETLGKTSDCKALVRGVLNKLPGIKIKIRNQSRTSSRETGLENVGFHSAYQRPSRVEGDSPA